MDNFSIEYILLAMQRALLGEVTNELRAVFIDLDREQEVFYAYFYYDGESTEQRIDLWDCAITEASAVLGHCFIQRWIKRLDYPQQILGRGYCAYLRKEGAGQDFPTGVLLRITVSEPTLGYALIAVQQTLLGKVTPELRAVIVDLETDPLRLYIRFYHDKEISEELYQYWQLAQQRAQVYFGFNCVLDAGVERVDYPQKMPFRGRYAYLRKE